VHEMAAAVNGQIVTEDGEYDHRRLTTIYTDHDLPEHDAPSQPAALHRSSVERQCESKAPEVPLIETPRSSMDISQPSCLALAEASERSR
jgi:hypothetical protein